MFESRISMETILLEKLKIQARAEFPDELLTVLSDMEVAQYRYEHMYRTFLELRSSIIAQRLEPNIQPVSFTRQIPVVDQTFNSYRMPATVWDHWKFKHRRVSKRLRLKPVRWVHAGYKTRPNKRLETVTINETVHIDRFRTYPNATVALPRDVYGVPVYREERRY